MNQPVTYIRVSQIQNLQIWNSSQRNPLRSNNIFPFQILQNDQLMKGNGSQDQTDGERFALNQSPTSTKKSCSCWRIGKPPTAGSPDPSSSSLRRRRVPVGAMTLYSCFTRSPWVAGSRPARFLEKPTQSAHATNAVNLQAFSVFRPILFLGMVPWGARINRALILRWISHVDLPEA